MSSHVRCAGAAAATLLLAAPAEAAFVDIGAGLTGVVTASTAWGDYDGDGDLDLVLSGETISGRIARIYRNDAGSFVSTAALPATAAVARGSLAWGDYDGDGDLDLAVAGNDGTSAVTQVLRNDGGSFVDLGLSLQGVQDGAVGWGDYDNDGDLDLAVTGLSGSTQYSKLYRNTGAGFTEFAAGLVRLGFSALAWGDYDTDGDLDLVLSGLAGTIPTTVIYRSNGVTFSPVAAALIGVSEGSLAWGDYDNDGDLDLLMTGRTGPATGVSRIYRNAGGAFSDIGAGLQGVFQGAAVWADFDNDADLDVVLAGTAFSANISVLYRNTGGAFGAVSAGIANAGTAALGWGDFDGDTDLDLALAGLNNGVPIARVYRNDDGVVVNAPPAAPGALSVTSDGTTATFHWDASADPQGGSSGLQYNLRVGTSSGANDLMPAMAGADGLRRVAQGGNVGQNLEWSMPLTALGGGNVYWSVQAIDQSFAGSAFATEQFLTLGIDEALAASSPALGVASANPFVSEAQILCRLPRAMHVSITIHDAAGRRIRSLAKDVLPAGASRLVWEGDDNFGGDCPAGTYLVQLRGQGVSASLKISKLR